MAFPSGVNKSSWLHFVTSLRLDVGLLGILFVHRNLWGSIPINLFIEMGGALFFLGEIGVDLVVYEIMIFSIAYQLPYAIS